MRTRDKIQSVGNEVIQMLLEKNKSYGDSALRPANIFANGSAVENLSARIDDKLMRIKNFGFTGFAEDNVKDLIGYLILLKIALEEERENSVNYQKPNLDESSNDLSVDLQVGRTTLSQPVAGAIAYTIGEE